jgi:hypothetical protein
MKYLIIISITLTFLLTSCEKEGLETNSKDIVPIEIGNKWVYTSYLIEDNQETEPQTSTLTIDSQTSLTINGELIETYQIKNTTGDLYSYKFVDNVSNGFIEYGQIIMIHIETSGSRRIIIKNENDTITYNSLIAKYPVQKGEKWETENIYYNYDYDESLEAFTIEAKIDTFEIECIETSMSIQTDLGKFSCVGYKYVENESYSIVYYAVGFGRIKSEFYENGELTAYSILTDIDIK